MIRSILLLACLTCGSVAHGGERPAGPFYQLSFSAFSGYPDGLGLNLGVLMPNVIEVQGGGAWFFGDHSWHVRAGYPWQLGSDRKNVIFLVTPKAGYRHLDFKHTGGSLIGGDCGLWGGDESDTTDYRRGILHGINAVLSLSWLTEITQGAAFVIELTGGATFRVSGTDREYVKTCVGGDILSESDDKLVTPDIRLAFGFAI